MNLRIDCYEHCELSSEAFGQRSVPAVVRLCVLSEVGWLVGAVSSGFVHPSSASLAYSVPTQMCTHGLNLQHEEFEVLAC